MTVATIPAFYGMGYRVIIQPPTGCTATITHLGREWGILLANLSREQAERWADALREMEP